MSAVGFSFKIKWLLFALIMLSPISLDAYLVLMPDIGGEFGVSPEITISAYLLALGLGQVFCGTLYDELGAKPIIISSLVLFSISSMGIYIADDFYLIVIFRIVQGLAIGGIVVPAMSCVKDASSQEDYSKSLGYIYAGMNIVAASVPFVGLYISSSFNGWRSVFFSLALLCAVFAVVTLLTKFPRTTKRVKAVVSWNFMGDLCYRYYGAVAVMSIAVLMLYVTIVSDYVQINLSESPTYFAVFFGFSAISNFVAGLIYGKVISCKGVGFSYKCGEVMLVVSLLLALISLLCPYSLLASFVVYGISSVFLVSSSSAIALTNTGNSTGKAVALISAMQMSAGAVLGFVSVALPVSTEVFFIVTLSLFLLLLFRVKLIRMMSS